jgi:hypothetical protein
VFIYSLSQWRTYMRLLLSNNKQVENSVNKDGMETWGNQQSAVQTGGEATPADKVIDDTAVHVTLGLESM